MTHSFDLRRIVRAACGVLVALALVACGGSDDTAAASAAASATATLGAAGGTLDGPAGAQLVVPAGALAQGTAITVAQSGVGAPALPGAGADVGAMFALTPHGTAFAVPAMIRVPFDASRLGAGEVPTLWKTNAAQNGWDQVAGAAVSGNVMQAQITSFSWVVIRTSLFPPSLRVQPAPQSVTEPAAATFAVGASSLINSGPLSYQWRRNGVPIAGATGPTYTTEPTSVVADNGALYSVDVSNSVGTTPSATAALSVSSAPVTTAMLTVTVTPASSGAVTSTPAGILCGADCTETYALNTAVTLTATPAAGFAFSAWSPNCPAGIVTMSGGTACTATFIAVPAPVSGVSRIAAGGGFSLAVDRAGVPYSWGNDSAGQLGNGEPNASRSTAAPLGTLTGVRAVAAGGEYQGVAIRTDGTVWAWGYRGFVDCAVGALASTPFQIAAAVNITAVSAGQDHTLLLRADKAVLAYGCNGHRQLGQPSQQVPPMSPPTVVAGLPPIKAVAAGAESSLALDEAGEVWAWGRRPGDRGASSANDATPTKIAGLAGVIAIALADDHALALKSDGSVWAWGSNRNGKLGDGTEIDRPAPTPTLLTTGVTALCAGGDNSLALRADGTVMAWGINETGQLGSGSASPGFRPQPAPVVGLASVVAIACGNTQLAHALAVLTDGTVRSWGRNGDGQLGDGSKTSALAPVVVPGLNLN